MAKTTHVHRSVATKIHNPSRVDERRAELVAAATELFVTRGFHQTSVRDLADALGWNTAKLYLYISRKEDVLFLIIHEVVEKLWDGTEDAAAGPGTVRERLGRVLRERFQRVQANRDQVAMLHRETAWLAPEHRPIIQKVFEDRRHFFAELVREGVTSGEFETESPDLVGANIMMLGDLFALRGWDVVQFSTPEEAIEHQVAFILRAIERRDEAEHHNATAAAALA